MRIILIETSTALCSTAICENGLVIASRRSGEPRSHAAMTAVYVDEMLREAGLTVRDCDAVCLSKGPGSYTGLRVGSSTAKGLCFGAGIPLIAVSTPELLFAQAGEKAGEFDWIVPMIDARRLEVYDAVFSPDGKLARETAPEVITAESFKDFPGKILLIGDGAAKCRPVLGDERFQYMECCPEASSMAALATEAFREKRFEDLAYFEPFYLKEFIATTPKKLL